MKYLKPITVVSFVLVIFVVLTFRTYFHQASPQYSGTHEMAGIEDTVEVFTDSFGMPYVFSKNNADLFFVAGYLTARERLFQLTLLSAILNGEVAALLGDEYLEIDQYLKTNKELLNIKDSLDIIDDNLGLIKSYCRGINSYIDECNGLYPVSFKLTNSEPRRWTPLDAINTLTLMTNHSLNSKAMILSAVRQYFGEVRYAELSNSIDFDDRNVQSITDIKMQSEIFNLIGASGSKTGSEAMVVFPSAEQSKKPILIFDDHWGYRQPTKWFNIYLNGGDFDLEGSLIPGFPLPIVGRTGHSAFAFTGTLPKDANLLFELARSVKDLNSIVNNNASIFYADTTGLISIGKSESSHFSLLNGQSTDINSFQDVLDILTEFTNDQKAEYIALVVEKYLERPGSDPTVRKILYWDGDESGQSTTALLANTILKHLVEGIFKDELALIEEDLYKIFISNTKFVENSLLKILRNPGSEWLDDINTVDYRENLSDVIEAAVDRALTELRNKYGTPYWEWGKVNRPVYRHVLSDNWLANIINGFDVVPVFQDGSNITEFKCDENLTPVSALALRKIYDLSNLNNVYSILPTGQSGLPNNPHYSDQLGLFTKGELREINVNREKIRNSREYRKLILYPAE